MTYNSSQLLESYIPVYDAVPETWEDARPFLVEQLKSVSNAANIREIGWYLDEELLSGKQFIPSQTQVLSGASDQYRSMFRKVIDCSPLIAGVNPVNHGITFDANFTLIHLYVSGTNSTTFQARTISGNDVLMNATQLIITSPAAFDRAFAVVEYILEQ